MNRIIIERKSPYYKTLCEFHTPYDYPFNAIQYACVDVDDEDLCMLKLRLTIKTIDPTEFNRGIFFPTYVIMNPYYP